LAIVSIFYYGLRRRGPWGSLWSFLLVLFLGIWMVAIWIEPIGPVWYDAAWLDLLVVGLILALLLAAATPYTPNGRKNRSDVIGEGEVRGEENTSVVAVGIFFWLLMFLLLALIIIGLSL
jgi:hypothetical protein